MSLPSQLFKSIKKIPGGIAGGYIDLNTDELICMLTMDQQPKELLDKLTGITHDLFLGPNVQMVEEAINNLRGGLDKPQLLREMIITTDHLMHVFVRANVNKKHIVTFVCSKDQNLAIVLTNAKAETPGLEAAYQADLANRKTG